MNCEVAPERPEATRERPQQQYSRFCRDSRLAGVFCGKLVPQEDQETQRFTKEIMTLLGILAPIVCVASGVVRRDPESSRLEHYASCRLSNVAAKLLAQASSEITCSGVLFAAFTLPDTGSRTNSEGRGRSCLFVCQPRSRDGIAARKATRAENGDINAAQIQQIIARRPGWIASRFQQMK